MEDHFIGREHRGRRHGTVGRFALDEIVERNRLDDAQAQTAVGDIEFQELVVFCRQRVSCRKRFFIGKVFVLLGDDRGVAELEVFAVEVPVNVTDVQLGDQVFFDDAVVVDILVIVDDQIRIGYVALDPFLEHFVRGKIVRHHGTVAVVANHIGAHHRRVGHPRPVLNNHLTLAVAFDAFVREGCPVQEQHDPLENGVNVVVKGDLGVGRLVVIVEFTRIARLLIAVVVHHRHRRLSRHGRRPVQNARLLEITLDVVALGSRRIFHGRSERASVEVDMGYHIVGERDGQQVRNQTRRHIDDAVKEVDPRNNALQNRNQIRADIDAAAGQYGVERGADKPCRQHLLRAVNVTPIPLFTRQRFARPDRHCGVGIDIVVDLMIVRFVKQTLIPQNLDIVGVGSCRNRGEVGNGVLLVAADGRNTHQRINHIVKRPERACDQLSVEPDFEVMYAVVAIFGAAFVSVDIVVPGIEDQLAFFVKVCFLTAGYTGQQSADIGDQADQAVDGIGTHLLTVVIQRTRNSVFGISRNAGVELIAAVCVKHVCAEAESDALDHAGIFDFDQVGDPLRFRPLYQRNDADILGVIGCAHRHRNGIEVLVNFTAEFEGIALVERQTADRKVSRPEQTVGVVGGPFYKVVTRRIHHNARHDAVGVLFGVDRRPVKAVGLTDGSAARLQPQFDVRTDGLGFRLLDDKNGFFVLREIAHFDDRARARSGTDGVIQFKRSHAFEFVPVAAELTDQRVIGCGIVSTELDVISIVCRAVAICVGMEVVVGKDRRQTAVDRCDKVLPAAVVRFAARLLEHVGIAHFGPVQKVFVGDDDQSAGQRSGGDGTRLLEVQRDHLVVGRCRRGLGQTVGGADPERTFAHVVQDEAIASVAAGGDDVALFVFDRLSVVDERDACKACARMVGDFTCDRNIIVELDPLVGEFEIVNTGGSVGVVNHFDFGRYGIVSGRADLSAVFAGGQIDQSIITVFVGCRREVADFNGCALNDIVVKIFDRTRNTAVCLRRFVPA